MANFVLVHGAFHGGWCWHKVVSRLRAMGHRVTAPDMPGHGIDRTPIEQVTLPDIVAKIGQAVDSQDGPVILVGHSYGGAIITQTAEARADKIAKLVYLTAILPPNGMSSMEAIGEDPESDLGTDLEYSADGLTASVRRETVRAIFYDQCGADDVALAQMLLVPEALAGFGTTIATSEAGFGRIPRVYIECRKDRAISLAKQRALYERMPCDEIFGLDTDHSPFFSTPDALSEILTGL